MSFFKIRLFYMFLLLLFVSSACSNIFAETKDKKYQLWYNDPAPNTTPIIYPEQANRPIDIDWENWSLPIGNGYMGACLFGRTESERLQITDKTLYVKGLWNSGTQTAFADLFIDFFHINRSNYQRGLILNDAVAYVNYQYDYVNYSRQYFMSYPDNVLVVKLKADKPGRLTFTVRPVIPYLVPYGPLKNGNRISTGYLSSPSVTRHDNNGRTGKVTANNDLITLRGSCEYFNLIYEGQLKVIPSGGKMTFSNDKDNDHGTITVNNADSAVLIFSLGTNYKLENKTFLLDPSEKLKGNTDPHNEVSSTVALAAQKGYDELLKRHTVDFHKYFSRVKIDLGSDVSSLPTDKLLDNYKKGISDKYLDELFYQYGRYLLISSSRKGALPPTLFGVWNQYELAPWNGNYTHNINIQMNYWPAFNNNLAEMFEPYVDYFNAYKTQAEVEAGNYFKIAKPKAFDPRKGENGWAIGTGAGAYSVTMPGGHSGPGTGALTSKLFTDYYEFTSSKEILKEQTYPAVLGMAKFLSKTIQDTLGFLLAYPSSSPEQFSKITRRPYQTLGCAFDQQMIYENHHDLLKYSALLKDKQQIIKIAKTQINNLDPVLIGASGQIKEYREEKFYGDLVLEMQHRHISHLMGLYPGTLINSGTPAWIDAAKVTLNKRGDLSTGWSMAHKMNLWARTKNGDKAYDLYQNVLKTATRNNLWTFCYAVLDAPNMIDANLGSTAGVAEMLLQSHEGYINPLPALPQAWSNGSYSGLVARGNFEISAEWNNGQAVSFEVFSRMGNDCNLKYYNLSKAIVRDSIGNIVKFVSTQPDLISFKTIKGGKYLISGIPEYQKITPPTHVAAICLPDGSIKVTWKGDSDKLSYNIYKVTGNNPNYQLVSSSLKGNSFIYKSSDLPLVGYNTIKVTALAPDGRESDGETIVVNKL